MSKSRIVTAIAAVVLVSGFLVYSVVAQQPAPAGPPAPGLIVLLDVTALIKDNSHLKSMMADMQRDVARAEQVFREKREKIRAMSEELKELKAGTPPYREKEERLTKDSTDLNVQMQIQRKEFLQRESKVYYTVYQEIQQEVDYFAANNNIAMVIRTSNEPVDVEKPDEIVREMTKPVVWNAKGLDITQYIRQQLQRRYGETNQGAPPTNARQGVPIQR